ncbi:hypothetical protein VII00023_09359, partial [Vibrio ichthyoenteri ATCC 700023]
NATFVYSIQSLIKKYLTYERLISMVNLELVGCRKSNIEEKSNVLRLIGVQQRSRLLKPKMFQVMN